MDGEAEILQNRVQAFAVHRGVGQPRKWIGGEQAERQKARADHALNRQNTRF